jgi:proliferating cell nuclear antigen PCNA
VLINLEMEKLGIPEAEYSLTINAERTAFHQLFMNLSTDSDTAKFTLLDGNLLISAEGEGGSFDATLRGNAKDDTFELELMQPLRPVEFSLKYLNKMTAATFCKRVVFDVSDDVPGRITYFIDDDEGDGAGALRFYLAPKISEDEIIQ